MRVHKKKNRLSLKVFNAALIFGQAQLRCCGSKFLDLGCQRPQKATVGGCTRGKLARPVFVTWDPLGNHQLKQEK